MKNLLIALLAVAALTGCVAVPYEPAPAPYYGGPYYGPYYYGPSVSFGYSYYGGRRHRW